MRLRITKWMLGLAAGLAVSAGAGAALAQCTSGCQPPPCTSCEPPPPPAGPPLEKRGCSATPPVWPWAGAKANFRDLDAVTAAATLCHIYDPEAP